MPGHCAPLALRRIPQDIAHAGNALGAGRAWRATGGGTWERFELHWQTPVPAHHWQVRSRAGLLGLTDLSLLQLGAGIRPDPGWAQDAFDDAAQLACACLDHQLAQALGGPLQWEPVACAQGQEERAAVDVTRINVRLVLLPAAGEDQHALTLCMAGETLSALLRDEQWEPLPPPPAALWMDKLPCPALVAIASVRVPLARLQTWGRGDLVVLCELLQGVRAVSSLRLGRIVVEFEAEHDTHTGMRACHSWRGADAWPDSGGTSMADPEHEESFPVDSVEVTLEVICGRTSLSVGELRALRPGSLVPMSCPASAKVDLVVGGVRVGAGELVQVDGWLAVEVRQLAEP